MSRRHDYSRKEEENPSSSKWSCDVLCPSGFKPQAGMASQCANCYRDVTKHVRPRTRRPGNNYDRRRTDVLSSTTASMPPRRGTSVTSPPSFNSNSVSYQQHSPNTIRKVIYGTPAPPPPPRKQISYSLPTSPRDSRGSSPERSYQRLFGTENTRHRPSPTPPTTPQTPTGSSFPRNYRRLPKSASGSYTDIRGVTRSDSHWFYTPLSKSQSVNYLSPGGSSLSRSPSSASAIPYNNNNIGRGLSPYSSHHSSAYSSKVSSRAGTPEQSNYSSRSSSRASSRASSRPPSPSRDQDPTKNTTASTSTSSTTKSFITRSLPRNFSSAGLKIAKLKRDFILENFQIVRNPMKRKEKRSRKLEKQIREEEEERITNFNGNNGKELIDDHNIIVNIFEPIAPYHPPPQSIVDDILASYDVPTDEVYFREEEEEEEANETEESPKDNFNIPFIDEEEKPKKSSGCFPPIETILESPSIEDLESAEYETKDGGSSTTTESVIPSILDDEDDIDKPLIKTVSLLRDRSEDREESSPTKKKKEIKLRKLFSKKKKNEDEEEEGSKKIKEAKDFEVSLPPLEEVDELIKPIKPLESAHKIEDVSSLNNFGSVVKTICDTEKDLAIAKEIDETVVKISAIENSLEVKKAEQFPVAPESNIEKSLSEIDDTVKTLKEIDHISINEDSKDQETGSKSSSDLFTYEQSKQISSNDDGNNKRDEDLESISSEQSVETVINVNLMRGSTSNDSISHSVEMMQQWSGSTDPLSLSSSSIGNSCDTLRSSSSSSSLEDDDLDSRCSKIIPEVVASADVQIIEPSSSYHELNKSESISESVPDVVPENSTIIGGTFNNNQHPEADSIPDVVTLSILESTTVSVPENNKIRSTVENLERSNEQLNIVPETREKPNVSSNEISISTSNEKGQISEKLETKKVIKENMVEPLSRLCSKIDVKPVIEPVKSTPSIKFEPDSVPFISSTTVHVFEPVVVVEQELSSDKVEVSKMEEGSGAKNEEDLLFVKEEVMVMAEAKGHLASIVSSEPHSRELSVISEIMDDMTSDQRSLKSHPPLKSEEKEAKRNDIEAKRIKDLDSDDDEEAPSLSLTHDSGFSEDQLATSSSLSNESKKVNSCLKAASTEELESILLHCVSSPKKQQQKYRFTLSTLPDDETNSAAASIRQSLPSLSTVSDDGPVERVEEDDNESVQGQGQGLSNLKDGEGRKSSISQDEVIKRQAISVEGLRLETEELKERIRQLEELDIVDSAVTSALASDIVHGGQSPDMLQLKIGYFKHEIQSLETKLNESEDRCFKLLEENCDLKSEVESMMTEIAEVQDTFHERDSKEWKRLHNELILMDKTCRNYQLKLRKAQSKTTELKRKNAILGDKLRQTPRLTPDCGSGTSMTVITNVAIVLACFLAGYKIVSSFR